MVDGFARYLETHLPLNAQTCLVEFDLVFEALVHFLSFLILSFYVFSKQAWYVRIDDSLLCLCL